MSEIQLDIPNIVVLVNNDPDYRKVIVKPDSNFNVNINVPRLVSRVSGSFIQFAETALTSSYALTANRLIDSGTLQLGYISASAMWISESVYVGGLMIGTASQALTASYALNAEGSGFPYSGSAVITGSLLVIPTDNVGGITGSLLGTASIAENITVIFAGTYETGSDNPIVPTPSGGLIYVTNADFAISASYANSAKSSSYAKSASSVHFTNVTNKPTLVSSSNQIDYNFIQNKPTNISSASFASSSVTASYALTASVALNLPANIITSSNQINSGSFTGSFTGALIGNLTGTSSWAVSASSVTYANVTNKPTLVSASSQIIATQITGIGAYATTASNTFTGTQSISNTTNSTNFTNGALIVQGGVGIAKDVNISGSLQVTGLLTVVSMSTQYVTSSQYNVGVSRITLNDDDNVRFAGISVVDSGSTYGTGSLLWDSLNNRWIYEADDQAYNSAIIIAGPKHTGALGNEPGLVNGRVPVASGDDHLDNRLESSSIRVDFPSRLTHIEAGLHVTGAINTNTGFTGSLLGTSSNAISSSYALTASFALNGGGGGTGAGFPYSGSAVITGSMLISSSGLTLIGQGLTGSVLGTSSYALTASQAITSSFIYGAILIEEGLNITGSVDISGSLSALGGITGSLLGTSSFANTASFALNAGAGSGFPFSGSAIITGSLLISSSGLTLIGQGLTGSVLGTSSFSVSSSFARSASWAPPASLGPGTVNSIAAFNSSTTVSSSVLFQSNNRIGIQVTSPSTLLQLGPKVIDDAGYTYDTSSLYIVHQTPTNNVALNDPREVLVLARQGASGLAYGAAASYRLSRYEAVSTNSRTRLDLVLANDTFLVGTTTNVMTWLSNGNVGVGVTNPSTRLHVNGVVSASSFAGTASYASSALTASYALNAAGGGSGAGFPFSGSAVITGSLLVSGSGLRVTGSTDIVGALTATTKSFLIDHKKLPGKKLVYGVLEGAEHAVYARGKLQGSNIIKLPDEWEWLVDINTITVQLTPIGKHQKLYVKSIDGLYVTIEAGGFITQEINCYYLVHATRKDVDPLKTVV